MKKNNIYNMNTNKKIGEVEATSVNSAELKFIESQNEYGSDEIYALTAEEE